MDYSADVKMPKRRLRYEPPAVQYADGTCYCHPDALAEANARIEKLEHALRWIECCELAQDAEYAQKTCAELASKALEDD